MATFSQGLKVGALSAAAGMSAAALTSCGGTHAIGGLPGRDSVTARHVIPQALQQNNGAQFVEYATQCSVPLGQLSHDVSGTSMWFTVPAGCKKKAPGLVGSVAIATGQIAEYALPTGASPLAIAENAGYIWVADRGKTKGGKRAIYQFNENGSNATFYLPQSILVSGLVSGSDGNLWFCGSYGNKKSPLAGVGYVTSAGITKLYEIKGNPTPILTSIASGSDGNLYVTDENGNIDQIAPAKGTSKTFAVGGHPASITNSSNVMVYSDESAAQLSIISTTGQFTVYPAPTGQHPGFLARKNDGSVVYIDTENDSDAIGTFEPSSGIYGSESKAPNAGLRYLYNGPDGNMWFTDALGHVGAYLKFILSTNPTSITLNPADCAASFTISETNFSGTFTVASQNTDVATVSPASGYAGTSFTVLEVASGITSIAVEDTMQNVVSIPVTVSGSGCAGSQTFEYTGRTQYFTVPYGITNVTITATGGYGGSSERGGSGAGGSVTATIPVNPSEGLAVNVGGLGGGAGCGDSGGPGGWNGGGKGADGASCYTYWKGGGGGGGGGASDIREGGSGLANRVVIAGGGGGAGQANGGDGGGLSGVAGANAYCPGEEGYGGAGGTQTSGGSNGIGTPGSGYLEYYYGPSDYCGGIGAGGGGGGYYGGEGGTGGGGGGGGSGYAEPNATGVSYSVGSEYGAGFVTISWGSSDPRRARTTNAGR
jgi:streptogramin lyase